jgi:hypothetical protein
MYKGFIQPVKKIRQKNIHPKNVRPKYVRGGMVALTFAIVFSLLGCTFGQSEAKGPVTEWMQVQPDPIRARQQEVTVMLSEKVAQSPAATLLYSSYVGGDGADYGKDVAVDGAGNIYVLGQTYSDVLFDEEIERSGYSDIFVAKFDPTGSELLSVVIGGDDSESPLSIEVDGEGNVYGTSYVSDETFPTKNARWPAPPESTNGALFKLDASGELVYSTYLPFDVFYSRHNLAVDAEGNAYVTGSYPWVVTSVPSFSAPDGGKRGVNEDEEYLRDQVGLLKFDPTGSEVLLDVMIGGNGTDRGVAIALDDEGNIYLAGTTSEGDGFPVTENAHQPECGDILYENDPSGYSYCYEDAVVVVLNPAGEVTYSSYHGGSFTDAPNAIGTDGKGNIMVAGDTASGAFPLVNAIQDSCQIASYSNDCESGRVYVSVIHLDDEQATLTYSTYLAASERNSVNTILAAAMDSAGNAYITGYTSGKKFPLLYPVQDELYESICYTFSSERYCFDAFVTKFSPTGELLMGTYLGAEFDEYPYGLEVDEKGAIYVVGTTEGSEFPTTGNAYEPLNQINDDAFLATIGLTVVTPTPPRSTPQ